ncbi:MAG: hypothetical protein A2294_01580 [Candidatus Magasanikbacteria bacterium RIFOXYB2_FULL_38_10]|nr:MAG: hypothetical protein A2294_01580 [Candidatus Magasanikbacteria bacterium RIFOXYB2_FULL_38_10]
MRSINKISLHFPWLDYFGIFCAVFLIWLMAALALGVFFYVPKSLNRLKYLFVLLASGAGSYFLSALVGFGYGRARPFVGFADLHQLIATSFSHKSFPSSHATIAFALATAVFCFNKPWGILMFVLAILVAWGRVFVGVHYPFDVLAGALLGMLTSLIIYRLII